MTFDEFFVCIQVRQLQDLNRIYRLSALIFRDARIANMQSLKLQLKINNPQVTTIGQT